MPQNDALLKAVESLSNQILSFHNDFKQSFYYLVDTINHNHDAENGDNPATPIQTPSQIPIFSQTPTRASAGVHLGREQFKFTSDEKEKETAFDKDVNQCIDSVEAQWKKLVKANSSNTHKSIRNTALASKYREWMQKDPPFFVKKFRPTPSQPENAEIDAIRVEQAKAFVENECRVMTLHAKNAQTANEALESQMKDLICGMTQDEKKKDALFRRWNDAKVEGETRELKKWEEKEKWFDKLPSDPSLEDVQEKSTAPKTKSAKSGPTSESTKSSDTRGKNSKKKNSRPEPNQKKGPNSKASAKGNRQKKGPSSRTNADADTNANANANASTNASAGANTSSNANGRLNRKKTANKNNQNNDAASNQNEPEAQNPVFRKRKPHPNRRKRPNQK